MKADEIHSKTSFLGVSVSADALNVSHTPTTLKAEHAEFNVTWPGFSHTTIAKGYEQRMPKPKPEPTTP